MSKDGDAEHEDEPKDRHLDRRMSKLESATSFQGALDKINLERTSAKTKKGEVAAIAEDAKEEEEPDKPDSDQESKGSDSGDK